MDAYLRLIEERDGLQGLIHSRALKPREERMARNSLSDLLGQIDSLAFPVAAA